MASVDLTRRNALCAIAAAPAALTLCRQPGRWQFKLDRDHFHDDGPLRADDVTGTTDYADWERSKISS